LKGSTVKLYTYYFSSAAYRVRIALNWKGLPAEQAFIHLQKAEQSAPAFKALNPAGLVPALEDGGRVLSQSLAIIEYLDEAHPGPKLMPGDPLARAYVRALSQLVACEIHPLNNLRVLNHLRATYALDQEGVNAWYKHWIAEGFAALEGMLAREGRTGRYCLGDQVTMADCCLVPQVFNANRYKCDMAPYPTAMRINDECLKLEAFAAAHPLKQPDAPPPKA
jgi:maleylpyruvate isomerase